MSKDVRIPYDAQETVRCPICGAEPGNPCVSRRYKIRWPGMPTIKAPHLERREEWFRVISGTEPTAVSRDHRYYFRTREAMDDDMHPNGFLRRDFYPEPRTVPEFGLVPVFGEIDYPEPLEPLEAWLYELTPADNTARALHTFLDKTEGDEARAVSAFRRYAKKGMDRLREMARRDRLARAAIPLVANPELVDRLSTT